MKILQLTPYLDPKFGGQEKHVLALSKTLTSLGHDVTILTCRPPPLNIVQGFSVSKIDSVNFLGIPIISVKELARFLRENRFDICHLHHKTIVGEITLLINKIHKLPTVTTLHSLMLRRLPARFLYDRLSLRFISTLSSRVICLSPRIMQSLVRRGLARSKCVVIPNAINVKSLKNRFRKIQRELQDPEFDLLFVGRLEQRKGIKWLLQSLILLHKKGKKVTLKIVGQGPLHDELNRIISANGLQRHVNLLGYVPDEELLKLFLLTRCVVVPSLYEGVPGVALEAMAAGKPLIVSNIPGLGELVVNRGNGLIVDPLDTQGLASAIDMILAAPYFLNSLTEVNENLLSSFDWKVVASRVLKTYHEALVNGRDN